MSALRLLLKYFGVVAVLIGLMPALTRQLMTPAEVGRELGRSKTTVTTWCEQGILPAIRIASRWYLKRPALVAAGFLPPDGDSAARSGEDREAAGEGVRDAAVTRSSQ